MNSKQLIASLKISRQELAEWIAQGLPSTRKGNGRQFDAEAVHNWLLLHGKAKTASVVATKAEVAHHFHVAERTIGTWLGAGMPGVPGQYDLDAISLWRGTRQQADPMLTGPTSPALERYREERAKLARLDRLAREGTLCDLHVILGQLQMFTSQIRGAIEDAMRTLPDHAKEIRDIFTERVEEAYCEIERKWNKTGRGAVNADNESREPAEEN